MFDQDEPHTACCELDPRAESVSVTFVSTSHFIQAFDPTFNVRVRESSHSAEASRINDIFYDTDIAPARDEHLVPYRPLSTSQMFETAVSTPYLSVQTGAHIENRKSTLLEADNIFTSQHIRALDERQMVAQHDLGENRFDSEDVQQRFNFLDSDETNGGQLQSRKIPWHPIQSAIANTQAHNALANFTPPVEKKRTRNNTKQVGANNLFGSKGVLSCRQCRRRRNKCNYISQWLPCEFCQSRNIAAPCFKVYGPKRAARLESMSRPVPTSDVHIINAEDALLLGYAYSDRSNFKEVAWFRLLATQYGTAISIPSLRHAILSLSAQSLPAVHFATKAYHQKQLAQGCLIQKLQYPNTIDVADVFAAGLLAEFAGLTGCASEQNIHVNGCMSMMRFLSNKSEMRPRDDLFIVLAPFVENLAFNSTGPRILVGVSSSSYELLPKTTFRQCVEYWEVLRLFCPPSTPKIASSSVRAMMELMGRLFLLSFDCICRVTVEESVHHLERSSCVKVYLKLIEVAGQDPEFLCTLHAMEQLLLVPSTVQDDGRVTIELALLQWQCLQLAITVLTSPSIMDGLDCPKANSIATLIASACRPRLPNEGPVKEYLRHSRHTAIALLLFGLTLPREKMEEFGDWIYQVLNDMGYLREVEALRKFQVVRTLNGVVDILGIRQWLTLASYSAWNRQKLRFHDSKGKPVDCDPSTWNPRDPENL